MPAASTATVVPMSVWSAGVMPSVVVMLVRLAVRVVMLVRLAVRVVMLVAAMGSRCSAVRVPVPVGVAWMMALSARGMAAPPPVMGRVAAGM